MAGEALWIKTTPSDRAGQRRPPSKFVAKALEGRINFPAAKRFRRAGDRGAVFVRGGNPSTPPAPGRNSRRGHRHQTIRALFEVAPDTVSRRANYVRLKCTTSPCAGVISIVHSTTGRQRRRIT